MNRATYCQYCGRMILFERTARGKNMPVDTPGVWYKPGQNGNATILNDSGEIDRGWIMSERADDLLFGHIPHFITCKRYKKKEQPKAQRKPETERKPQYEQATLFS